MNSRWVYICLLVLWTWGGGGVLPSKASLGTNGDSSLKGNSFAAADTVYVAQLTPVEVTYVTRLDTLVVTASASEAPSQSRQEAASKVSLGGFVMNETRSVIGENFYDAFYSRWEAPDEASNFTVRVEEEPVPRFGTRIIVRVEETEVFQGYLKPRTRQIERAAEQATSRAGLYLRKYHRPREVY